MKEPDHPLSIRPLAKATSKEGEEMYTWRSYLFWSESCREMPESQSTSPAGRSRTQNRGRDQGRARNWALSCHLMNVKEKFSLEAI